MVLQPDVDDNSSECYDDSSKRAQANGTKADFVIVNNLDEVMEEKEDEKEKKKKKKKDDLPPVGIIELFRFASGFDMLLIGLASLAAIIGGCSMPVMIILFGDLTNAFVQSGLNMTEICATFVGCCNGTMLDPSLPTCENLTDDALDNFFSDQDFMTSIRRFGAGTSLIGLVNLVMSYIFVTALNHSAERQVFKVRGLFLKSILRQNIGWYDTHETGDFASRMTDDLNKLQEGIGEKIGMFLFFVTIFIASLVNAFVHGWELTLVIMSAMPIMIVATAIIAKSQTSLTEKELVAYSKAGAIAEEVLSSVRTVVAFGGQEKEVERYEGKLFFARKAGILRNLMTAIGGGLMWLIIYASYALAFWYGVKLIMDDTEDCLEDPSNCNPRYDASSLIIVFFSVLMGAMNVGQSVPYVEAFSSARGAAAMIYNIIDRVPEIDSASKEGKQPKPGSANIQLKNVHFCYPSRRDVPILKGLSLKINKGETVALVGPSGCGKSTVLQLIQRFYDPDQGAVLLEGDDIRDLNLGALRDCIGIVGQEPVLFGCTIAENIRYGRDGVTDAEIVAASKDANAYDFIQKLPKKFDTMVGERGAQLSGGQKQRIAIARALVRNPSVLLLDEATSALDTHSEVVVQEVLDSASHGRTTVVVAHRLSTIRGADKIITFKEGQVFESGTHAELMKAKGLYYSLVMAQIQQKEEDPDESEDSEGEEDAVVAEVPTDRRGERTFSVSSVTSGESATDHEWQRRDTVLSDSISKALSDENLPKPDTLRILRTSSPEWMYLVVGGIASVVMGASIPLYAILFGEVLGTLSENLESARSDSVFYSILFLITGIIVGTAMFLQTFMFGVAGEHLTLRMRKSAFQAMLSQEIGWFDHPENGTGALCAKLSSDASAIQGATGNRLGTILQSVFTLVISLSLALFYEWRLGLVTSLFIPLLLAAMYFQTKVIMGHDTVEKEAFADSAKLAIEAISNIRTVASLRREQTFVDLYLEALVGPHNASKKKSHVRGLIFGFAQSLPFFAYATCMYFGGSLVDKGEIEYKNVFKVAEALILGTMMVGQATAFAPNYNKAVIAAARIFALLDRRPLIDSSTAGGLRINNISGNISFDKATFRYPTRREVRVLRHLSLSLQSGQKIALVGPSGCGKSTCIQLLQRFYSLESGHLLLENQNIESLNVPLVRSSMGIVSQEPVLFDRTIAENIQYGDNARTVAMDEVIDAAKKANIHNFIASLPQGYDTRVGDKGAQLSGGQKQRVAIARALVRNPRILLLDEATSALDTESEKIVQEALDNAQEGRTSITIAHRLSTVQNMDKIFVISHGRVVESGTHNQLIEAKRLYYSLWRKQQGQK